MQEGEVAKAVSVDKLRPTPMPTNTDRQLKAIIEESWAQEPDKRPTAANLHKRIKIVQVFETTVHLWTCGREVVHTQEQRECDRESWFLLPAY
jgi:hypothetical protein